MQEKQNKRVIIHVGAHKTGTSLIQKYVRDRPEDFSKFGLNYISRSDMNKYVGWGKGLKENPDYFRKRVAKELAKNSTKIVFSSHENTIGRAILPGEKQLYPHACQNLLALRKTLSDFDVSIVLSIRPQIEFVQSLYLQQINEGKYYTFDNFLSNVPIETFSWKPVVNIINNIFGKKSLILIDFRTIKNGQNEFLKTFFSRIDSNLNLKPDYKPIRNPSLSEKGLKIALAANPYLSTSDERKKMRTFLQKEFSNRKSTRPVLMNNKLKTLFFEMFDAEYKQLTETATASTAT